jgi:hypothetical protein
MYQLKKCLGLASSAVHNFDISGLEYRNSKFAVGIDTEKIEAGWTRLNNISGDLLSIFFKLARSNPPAERQPDRVHVVVHADLIMQVHEMGVSVLN